MVKILKILKNLFLSLLISTFIAFTIPLAYDLLLDRVPRFSGSILGWNLIIIAFLIFLTSFIHFNSTKDSYKKKSDKLFIILVIYCFTSNFLLTLSLPWEFEKFDVAWQESQVYTAGTENNDIAIILRWDEAALSYNLGPTVYFSNSSCYKEGGYEVRLKGNSSINIWTYEKNSNDLFDVYRDKFEQIPGIKKRGKNILLISDACGYSHQVDVTGYNMVRKFQRFRF